MRTLDKIPTDFRTEEQIVWDTLRGYEPTKELTLDEWAKLPRCAKKRYFKERK